MSGPGSTGDVVVVTGATGGMGSAVARRMAKRSGSRLILCDLDPHRLDQLAAELGSDSVAVEVLASNVADPEFPQRLLATLDGAPLATLVHTAGISVCMGTPEQILDVNLGAAVRLVEAVRDHVGEGSAVVLIASNSSYLPINPEWGTIFEKPFPAGGVAELLPHAPVSSAAYVLSKRGVRALVRREMKAFGARGARIVSLSPGATDTPMVKAEMEQDGGVQEMADKGAFGRLGRPDEIAAVVEFLCSDGASLITGCDVLVDGGQLAGWMG